MIIIVHYNEQCVLVVDCWNGFLGYVYSAVVLKKLKTTHDFSR